MSELEALILGVLQGATEFLPVSSSGHLVMGQELLGLSVPGIAFEVVLHVATLLSVFVVYRGRILELVTGALVKGDRDAWRYLGLLALATLPAAIVGLGFRDRVEALFEEPAAVGVALLVTGALLFSTRWALRRPAAADVGVGAALLIGIAQCVALAPGISRSGSTVAMALWLGVRPVEAAGFSFLLSIPAIGGAALLQAPDLAASATGIGTASLAIGFVFAALTGVLAIRLFVRMLENRSFPAFSWYCWGAGILFLGWLALAGG